LAKKLNITKQDRLTFARLSELVAQPVLKEDAFYKYINYHIKPSKEDYELDYSHGKI
jgi:hypothetical protein